MIRTKDELLKKISDYVGEDSADSAIELLEDVTDTITDYETKVGEDWKTKYEENDAAWRKRYRERFETADPTEGDNDLDVEETPEATVVDETPMTYEDLFLEVKE